VALALLYVALPALAGLDETWQRVGQGDPAWLVAAFVLELLSFGSYALLFGAVTSAGGLAVDFRLGLTITLAGLAATRLFAAAGAGGIALTAWALHGLGMTRPRVATTMSTLVVALYAVFMAAVALCGIGLASGLLSGPSPAPLTILPALLAIALIAGVLVAAAGRDRDLGHQLDDERERGVPRLRRWLHAAETTTASGVGGTLALLRARDARLLGAVGWWAFDVAVLWACFNAFGEAPPVGVVVMGYFVGMAANVLPVPGGIGSVDGGMIGALVALDVSAGLAIVAVLTYRAFAFWLPTLPGAIAYGALLRRLRDP
jgi:putative heme transporter